MDELRLQEATSRRIELPDDYVGSIARMVQYCYTMDYTDENADETLNSADSIEPSYISPAYTNAQVYALAEKYDIAGLKFLAKMKFDKAMVVESRLADMTHSDVAHLITIISFVYNSTPGTDRTLRDHVIGEIWMHWNDLTPMPEFHTLIAANPELMIEFVNKKCGPSLPW